MKTGVVVGKVWATKRLEQLPPGALLEIDLDSPSGSPERIVAFDPLGCGEGERVLVTQGSVAKAWFDRGDAVVDALVVGSLDEPGRSAAGPGSSRTRGRAGSAAEG
jgi:ethanolamine utilization protein EutN